MSPFFIALWCGACCLAPVGAASWPAPSARHSGRAILDHVVQTDHNMSMATRSVSQYMGEADMEAKKTPNLPDARAGMDEEATDLEGLKDGGVRIRVPSAMTARLKELAERDNWTVSEMVREAIATYLENYEKKRAMHLWLMRDMAPELVKQAEELFRQLPGREIADDEPLHWGANDAVELVVKADATGAFYCLKDGTAVRLRRLSERKMEVTVFHNHKQVDKQELPIPFEMEREDAQTATAG